MNINRKEINGWKLSILPNNNCRQLINIRFWFSTKREKNSDVQLKSSCFDSCYCSFFGFSLLFSLFYSVALRITSDKFYNFVVSVLHIRYSTLALSENSSYEQTCMMLFCNMEIWWCNRTSVILMYHKISLLFNCCILSSCLLIVSDRWIE